MSDPVNVQMEAVGTVSRAWDEQAGELTAARTQLDGASTSGFTPEVAPAAAEFLRTWAGLADGLTTQAEGFGDQLRATIRTYLDSDEAVGLDFALLGQYLEEGRR